jgi:PhnB protein
MAEEQSGPANGVTAYLTIRDGRGQEAAAFYARAFGAQELFRHPAEDGKRLMHCSLMINGGPVMLSDDFPEMRGGAASPEPAGVTLHLQVPDAGAVFSAALAAGAVETMPLALQFWGDLYGKVRDPFGHAWSIGSTPNRA